MPSRGQSPECLPVRQGEAGGSEFVAGGGDHLAGAVGALDEAGFLWLGVRPAGRVVVRDREPLCNACSWLLTMLERG